MIFLDHNPDLNRTVPLEKNLPTELPPGNYTQSELLLSMLISSDNAAAETLATNYSSGRDGFINAMNNRAQQLGMLCTNFVDPSGDSQTNLSTATDIHKLLLATLSYGLIQSVTSTKQLLINNTYLQNSNLDLLSAINGILINKTGRGKTAKFCQAMVITKNKKIYTLILLGIATPEERSQFTSKLAAAYVK